MTRQAVIEQAFSGTFWNHAKLGIYSCVCCSTPVFKSISKLYSSRSLTRIKLIKPENFLKRFDKINDMIRDKVLWKTWDTRLGYVFRDGPRPTGLRYCISSVTSIFEFPKVKI